VKQSPKDTSVREGEGSRSPLVSVVVPAYRHAQYVEAALESVARQSLSDLELIVIDDASPDDTWEVIQRFRDPRLRVFRNPLNLGAHATINRGIDLSKGCYVAILNSDDIFHPDRLRRLLELADQGYDFIVSGVTAIDAEGIAIGDESHPWIRWYRDLKQHVAHWRDPVRALFCGNFTVSTSNFFVRRSVFGRMGRLRPYRYVHDYDFALRLVLRFPQRVAALLDEPLLQYRLHQANTILEDAVGAERERLQLLAHWLPRVARTDHLKWALTLRQQLVDASGNIEWLYGQQVEDLTARATQADTKLVSARTRLAQVQAELAQVQAELAQVQAELARAETELDSARTLLAQVQARLSASEENLEAVEKTAAAKAAEIKILRGSYSYRLGHALLEPARLGRRVFRVIKRSDGSGGTTGT
jgi:glycosyltransferase involved in cell wall biosynthesis